MLKGCRKQTPFDFTIIKNFPDSLFNLNLNQVDMNDTKVYFYLANNKL